MLPHPQTMNIISFSRKIKKPAKKLQFSEVAPKRFRESNTFPSKISSLDPIKSPFFSNFTYYPSSVKRNIMRINRKPLTCDLEHMVKDLSATTDFTSIEDLRSLVQDQEKLVSSLLRQNNEYDIKEAEKLLLAQKKLELKEETKMIIQNSPVLSNESEETIKEYVKRENSFSEGSFTCSTTPSKKGSPIYTERKNLLLSSQIENILNDNVDLFVKRFDEESFNLDSIEEESSRMYYEGIWNDREKNGDSENFFFKSLDFERQFFSNDKEMNFF